MKTIISIFVVLILVFILVIPTFVIGGTMLGWADTWFTNKVEYIDQKIEDRTSYDTRKEVEDTCRSMIASYNTDKGTYLMYKDSDNTEKLGWAEQARMRANSTANKYNEYVLKNSFVFEGNIPADILSNLPLI